MTTQAKDEKATREMQPVLRWAGVNWLPHYSKRDYFVAPGGVEKHRADLMRAGAVLRVQELWTR